MAFVDTAHPSALIHETLEGIFEETDKKLTVTEVATGLCTTRETLSAIINGKQSILTEMAIRSGTGFTSTTPEFWLTVQENSDLAQARRKVNISTVKLFWKQALFSSVDFNI